MTWTYCEIEPALARGVLRDECWDPKHWAAEVKYDGDRRIAQFCDGAVRFTGRKKSVVDGRYVEKTKNVPHLAYSMIPAVPQQLKDHPGLQRAVRSLDGTVLDGEMVSDATGRRDEGRSKFVTSIMGSHPSLAIEKQHARGWLRYVAFDILYYRGEDVRQRPYSERCPLLIDALQHWGHPYTRIAEACPDADYRGWVDRLWEDGNEGIILKRRGAIYGDRQAWVKVKNVLHVDGVIMGYEEAKKTSTKVTGTESITKYYSAGWIGALKVGQYIGDQLVEIASVSGMDDALREDISRHRKRYLGRVVEVKANGREPTGRYRHPQFVRFRDDKRPEDCTYAESES